MKKILILLLAGMNINLYAYDTYIENTKLQNNKAEVLLLVKKDGNALQYAHDDLKKDKEVVFAAIQQNSNALQYAHSSVKNDRSFLLKAVQYYALALKDANKKKDIAQNTAKSRLYSALMQKGDHANTYLKQPTVAKHYFAQAAKESINTLQENNARISMNFINTMKLDKYYTFDQNKSDKEQKNDTLLRLHYLKNKQAYDVWSKDLSKALRFKENKLIISNTIDKKDLFTITHQEEISKALFDNNMSKVLTISQTQDDRFVVKITDIHTKQECYTNIYSDIQAELITFSEDSSKILIPDINNSIYLIDSHTGNQIKKVDIDFIYHQNANVEGIDEIKLLNNILLYLYRGNTHNESMLIAYNIENEQAQILNQSCEAQNIKIVDDTLFAISNCSTTGADSYVESWDTSTYFPLSADEVIFSSVTENILDVQKNDDHIFIILNQRVLVLDDIYHTIIYELNHNDVSAVLSSKETKKITTYNKDNNIKVWVKDSNISIKKLSHAHTSEEDAYEERNSLTIQDKTLKLTTIDKYETKERTIMLEDTRSKQRWSFSHQKAFYTSDGFYNFSYGISKDEKRIFSLAVKDARSEMIIYNIDEHKIELRHIFNEALTAIAFSPDPENIFIVTFDKIHLWNMIQKESLYDFHYISNFTAIEFSSDQKMFVMNSGSFGVDEIQGEIQVRDFVSGKKLLGMHITDDDPTHVGFTNNNQWIKYNDHSYFNLLDIQTNRTLIRLPHIDYNDYTAHYTLSDHKLKWISHEYDIQNEYTLNLLKQKTVSKEKLPSLMIIHTGTSINKWGELTPLSPKEWQSAVTRSGIK